MKIHLVHELAGLSAIEREWQALYERLPHASIFTSPGWVLNWIDRFAPSGLYCVLVYNDDGLQAVLPLVKVKTRWRRVPVVALLACTNAHSVRSALLYQPHLREAIFSEALRALRTLGGWDLLLLDGCEGMQNETAIPCIPREQPMQQWQHSSLSICGPWRDYLASRSRDFRRNLRRAEEGFSALGHVTFEVHCQDPDRLFAQWAEIDNASWKSRDGEVVDSNAQTHHYYRNMLRRLAVRHQLLGGVLLLDGVPIATVICAYDKGVCHTLKTAMRDAFTGSRLSPGALVMAKLLEHVWTHPQIHSIDFVSKQPYTERWTSENQTFQRRVGFANSWRGNVARYLDTLWLHTAFLRSSGQTIANN